ncbi:PAS domain-containing sensor histidine kinase [Dokdonia sp. PRO95]|uniref:PAS domain-containing sensor histidine kinase n=1 Tax=Dokdonia sp. PRO95 TaxID=1239415 RepID=UPI0005501D19|nr:PAS domain-containing sensor histidine kinase [Dokdonia sp. PRO95]
MSDPKIKMYERALAREKAARKEAERILEEKSLELYHKSEELRVSNSKLEDIIKERTSELEGVFENIVDAYVVMELSGNVIKMNDAAMTLLGYSLEDNFNLWDIVHPDENDKVVEGFEILTSKGAITDFQIKIIIASGAIKLVHINASIVFNADGKPIAAQGIVRDITQVKEAEQRLIDSENRLSALILNLESGILLEDEYRNIVITNNRFCNFFNITATPEQLIGVNCENAAIESKHLFKDPEEFLSRINALTRKKEQALSDELKLIDGRILERDFIPIYEDGVYKGHLWTYRDVTLRRKFRESIEAERQKYSDIIANMNLGLTEVNLDNEILMANNSFELLSGYKEQEILGKNAKELLLTPASQEKLARQKKKRLKGISNSYEVEVITKSGELKHLLISAAPNYNINGKVIGSIGVHLDITELKSLELEKENLLKKLEKRNDELQEYAHVVSHDLKSPLRSINALVNWIRDDNEDVFTEETKSHLEMIDTTLEKMEQLISDVLEYSSAGSENTASQRVNLQEVLADIKTLLHCPEHITLSIHPDLPTVNGDKVKLQQLFQNLMSNAIRYCDKDKGLIEVGFTESKTHYTFTVKDNGIGIPKEYHDKIFKIFQSLNNHKDSTGIGLSIVKKIVDLYQGNIWLESTVGEGTTFFFTLQK